MSIQEANSFPTVDTNGVDHSLYRTLSCNCTLCRVRGVSLPTTIATINGHDLNAVDCDEIEKQVDASNTTTRPDWVMPSNLGLPPGVFGPESSSSVSALSPFDASNQFVIDSLRLARHFGGDCSSTSDLHSNGGPQVFLSSDGILHIKLSPYVSLERSTTAYRLINYRNNSAVALSENGKYGFIYHVNCRGLVNLHHGKLSMTFDKERQILLRNEKPSFVRKGVEFYRLTSHHWSTCRSLSIDSFERDKTPDILRKSLHDKPSDLVDLKSLISSSTVHRDENGLKGK